MYTTHRPKDEDTIKVPSQKPRSRHLHEVMAGRAGGRMTSPKDHNRQREKRELRRLVNEV